MSTTSKLAYLNNTKGLLKYKLNSLGATITSSTTFRNYLTWLDTFYGEVSDKTDLSVNGVVGRTSQETTSISGGDEYDSPSPDHPQPINNLSGDVPYKVNGKNKLPFPYTETTHTSNGVTFTIYNDGTILVNGTATGGNANTKLYGNYREQEQLKLPSGYLYGGTTNVWLRALNNHGGNYSLLGNDTGEGAEIDTTTYDVGFIELTVKNGTTVNNVLVKPMVLDSLEDTTYEPYISQTFNIPLGNIELCEIDTYKDKIYSSSGRFYLEKNCGSSIFGNDTQVNGVSDTQSNPDIVSLNGTYVIIKNTLNSNIKNDTMYCTIAKYEYNSIITDNKKAQDNLNDNTFCMRQNVNDRIYFKNSVFTGKKGTEIKGFIEGKKLYYVLNTPTTTEITSSNYPELYASLKEIQDYLTSYKINKEFILGYSSPTIDY